MRYERGEIFRVNLGPTQGAEQEGHARPCILLSLSNFNSKLPTVAVVPLSSSPAPRPPIVPSVPSAGRETSVALCHQIRVIDRSRIFGEPLGTLSEEDLESVEQGVRLYLGL